MFECKSVLVTGGAGFIGSHFVKLILEKLSEVKVINLDALTYAGSTDNLISISNNSNYYFIQGDICDRELVAKLLREYEINTIVHFAAESHVDRSITGPAAFIQTNLVGTFSLLEEARRYWLDEKKYDETQCRFHHISTDEVYGSLELTDPAFSETTQYQPNSPYSASKAGSDHLVRSYQHTYQLPTTISNCSNNYGPFQHSEKLIPTIIRNAFEGKSIPLYGDGKNIRDWLHVVDHCEAIFKIVRQAKTGETYNIGSDNEWNNLDLANLICDLMDKEYPSDQPHKHLITFVEDRKGHDRRYAIDSRKIKSELDWNASRAFKTGLKETIAFYIAQL